MKKITYLLVVIIFCFSIISPVMANDAPELISEHGDWKVYSFIDKGSKVCFMSSQPKKKEGKYKKRGEVFIFITHWSSDKDKNVVSVSNGYTFKKKSKVALKVNGNKYKLFTQEEMAWAKNQKIDDKLTDDIKKGNDIKVKGFSKFGTETNDTYSLKGSADAYRALVKACN